MSQTILINRTLTICMSDESSIDVEIAIRLQTEEENSISNQKMKEFNGIDQIDSMERSIVANLCDPGADEEEDD